MRKAPKLVKHNLTQVEPKSNSGYDAAISDAERQLSQVRDRERGLLKVIEDLKRLKDNGQPWPAAS
jgi:hypothetical protein